MELTVTLYVNPPVGTVPDTRVSLRQYVTFTELSCHLYVGNETDAL
jgi:hypothetical protein